MSSDARGVALRKESAGGRTQPQRKIDEAVAFINEQANATAKSLLAIGTYLLTTFFDGDPGKVRQRGPHKDVSLRQIADHPAITLSFMTLSNAVRLATQERLFTDARYGKLTESHKLLLFQIPDDATKRKYADLVVERNLTVRQFRDILVDHKLIAQRGRKALGANGKKPADLVKTFFQPIRRLSKLTVDLDGVDPKLLTKDRVTALKTVRERIDAILKKAAE
ncbi:MAG TPA: hypothetical protein PLV45_06485 [bacterium]|nr:hypothetical protein [bacterium]